MRIAAKLKLFASVPILIALIICLAILFSHKTMERSLEQGRITRQIMHSMNELNDLVRSYMIYQNDRPKLQFFMEDKNFLNLMASITFDEHDKQQLIDSMHRNFGSMKDAFLKLVSHHESTITAENEEIAKMAAERLEGRISIKSRDMLSDALRLESLIHNGISSTQQRINLLILILIIAVTVPLTFALIGMIRRINKPLLELKRGTEFIAAGDLNHRTAITTRDEIGELSMAFDLMTEKLSATTVSRDELLKEIEERKQAEAALRESKQRWAITVNSIGDAVITTGTDGRITFLNKMAEMLTGWPMAEAVGKNVQEVFRIVNEYSRAVVDDPVRKVLSSGLIVGIANHTLLLRKDGSDLPIDDSAAPIRDEADHILGVVLIFRDITERRKAENTLRESEAKYRNLFQNMTEEVHFWQVVRDHSGEIKTWRLLDVNPPALKTWGRKTVDEIKGKTTDEIFGPSATEHYLPIVQKIMTERTPHSFEDYFPHLDKYFRFTSVPVGDCFITTGADITNIKKAEHLLVQLNETLEQRVSERTELAEARSRQLQALAVELIEAEEQERRRIAHLLHDDLQQMLAAAKMQLQSLSESFPNELMIKNVWQILGDSIVKTRQLSHELSPAVLYHSGLIEGLKWLSGQMNGQFGLVTAIEKNTDVLLESTPLKVFLFRAVQELLFNIVKHAGVKTARINLSSSNDFFAITVSDQGQGFDPTKLEKASDCIGFGLLTIKERARFIGGSLTIDSAPGKGSRFTLKVPSKILHSGEEVQ
jgi:PAS domain S-box-containing protein